MVGQLIAQTSTRSSPKGRLGYRTRSTSGAFELGVDLRQAAPVAGVTSDASPAPERWPSDLTLVRRYRVERGRSACDFAGAPTRGDRAAREIMMVSRAAFDGPAWAAGHTGDGRRGRLATGRRAHWPRRACRRWVWAPDHPTSAPALRIADGVHGVPSAVTAGGRRPRRSARLSRLGRDGSGSGRTRTVASSFISHHRGSRLPVS